LINFLEIHGHHNRRRQTQEGYRGCSQGWGRRQRPEEKRKGKKKEVRSVILAQASAI